MGRHSLPAMPDRGCTAQTEGPAGPSPEMDGNSEHRWNGWPERVRAP